MRQLLNQRILVQGFLNYDLTERYYDDFIRDVSAWIAEGKVKYKEDIVEGLENAPQAFCMSRSHLSNVFPYQGLCFAVVVAVDVALHRVCIRTLMSRMRSGLGAGWGSRGESMLPFIGRPQGPKR
jgi:hypothetical protein